MNWRDAFQPLLVKQGINHARSAGCEEVEDAAD